MAEVVTMQNGSLPLPPQIASAVGLRDNDLAVVVVEQGRIVARPVSAGEAARQRLHAHLQLPVGSLAHRAINPDEPATVESELAACEDIYADTD